MKLRVGIVVRVAMALLVAATVFIPVAAQAATCAMPVCTDSCCQMAGSPSPASGMSIDSCCDEPGATMSSSSCPTGSERPDFKAVSAVPEAVSPAVPVGTASLSGPDLGKGRGLAFIAANARGPGDQLAGTRMRV